MAEERDTYEATRARLEEIATSVRKKDVTLEKSIELLEEGVRLANLCTEQVDQAGLTQVAATEPADGTGAVEPVAAESETGPGTEATQGADTGPEAGPAAANDGDEDVLAEAFADVEPGLEREACEGQTEAFGD